MYMVVLEEYPASQVLARLSSFAFISICQVININQSLQVPYKVAQIEVAG